MTASSLLNRTIQNYAKWCEWSAKAYGFISECSEHCWSTGGDMPQIYPNANTLQPHMALNSIKSLLDKREDKTIAVHDSFHDLDLQSLGFQVLFEAEWLTFSNLMFTHKPGIIIDKVQSKEQLQTFTEACCDAFGTSHLLELNPNGLYPESLLNNPDIRFYMAWEEDEIIGGMVLHRSHGVVGLSNLFCDDKQVLEALLLTSQHFIQEFPIVTYSHDEELSLLLNSGCQLIGPLRVWLKP